MITKARTESLRSMHWTDVQDLSLCKHADAMLHDAINVPISLKILHVIRPMSLHCILERTEASPGDCPRVGCKFSITTCLDRLLPSVLYREIRKERLFSVCRSVHECRIIRAIEAAGRKRQSERKRASIISPLSEF